MDYLRGKIVEADKDIDLLNVIVDNKIYSVNDFYIPKIRKGRRYVIERSDDFEVVLKNPVVNEWVSCEIPLYYIDDFKIIKKSQI